MEKAVAFKLLPALWDQTKSYCLKNYQIIYKELYDQKQVPLSFKFGGILMHFTKTLDKNTLLRNRLPNFLKRLVTG